MEPNEDLSKEVRCENCGCAFIPELILEQDGDIEYTFFRCPFCGKAYMVSVTDGHLRHDIKRYTQMILSGRMDRMTPEQFQEAKELLASNIRRSCELRSLYLRETDK